MGKKPRTLEIDVIDIDGWHKSLAETMTAKVTEFGRFPHRASGTVLAMNLRTLGEIMELAKIGQQVQGKAKGKLKIAVASELRKLADQVENES